MNTLSHAHRELFRRRPDECFPSLVSLAQHCQTQKDGSVERWRPPQDLTVTPSGVDRLLIDAGNDGEFTLSSWSFGQLCRHAGVGRDTVNRLTAATAAQVFAETLPTDTRPLQLLTTGSQVRSVHGTAYTRLFNADLLSVVREFAVDFEAPPVGLRGATGLYAGEQDMFCFLIDPTGWTEIGGQAFAPGFYLWNSEVGRRSLGLSTFWFQAICGNHLVWDPVEVQEMRRKHTAQVHDGLREVRQMIETLVQRRDERRTGFVQAIESAMATKLGTDEAEVLKQLGRAGVRGKLAKAAIDAAQQQGALTIFSLVDALTRLAQDQTNAGERLAIDQQAAVLLSEVA